MKYRVRLSLLSTDAAAAAAVVVVVEFAHDSRLVDAVRTSEFFPPISSQSRR